MGNVFVKKKPKKKKKKIPGELFHPPSNRYKLPPNTDLGLNECRDCQCRLCTECLVQIKPFLKHRHFRRQESDKTQKDQCPFCKKNPFQTSYRERTKKEKDEIFVEQQKVMYLKIQHRNSMILEEKERENFVKEMRKEKTKKKVQNVREFDDLNLISEEQEMNDEIDQGLYDEPLGDVSSESDELQESEGEVGSTSEIIQQQFNSVNMHMNLNNVTPNEENSAIDHIYDLMINLAIQQSLKESDST